MFQHVEAFAGDAIVALNEAFHRDPRPHKVNLSIGIYSDEHGQVPAQHAVCEAEQYLAQARQAKPYLPMEGSSSFRNAMQGLLFGAGHEILAQGRVATVQTVGSSGALKAGAEFIRQWFPASAVWLSDPTWDNHRSIFESAGLAVHTYPYYAAEGGVRFEAMLETLRALPRHSVVLLHACCHNPTGVDLTPAQWQLLIPVLQETALIPFLDLAYQGFGDGLEEDAYAVRALVQSGMCFLLANTLSKSMGVYAERCGALSVVCADAAQAECVLGQLKSTVRQSYFSPPAHGSQVVARVLEDPQLRASWERDLTAMRERIRRLRHQLHTALTRRLPERDFGYLLTQRGMFSYTNFTAQQVRSLRESHAIYLVNSGRMCISGLRADNVERVADAMAAVSVGMDEAAMAVA
jgi:aromatic-amino-acid transaminase